MRREDFTRDVITDRRCMHDKDERESAIPYRVAPRRRRTQHWIRHRSNPHYCRRLGNKEKGERKRERIRKKLMREKNKEELVG